MPSLDVYLNISKMYQNSFEDVLHVHKSTNFWCVSKSVRLKRFIENPFRSTPFHTRFLVVFVLVNHNFSLKSFVDNKNVGIKCSAHDASLE